MAETELKPIWEWLSDDIDFDTLNNIPDWVDPRDDLFFNKGKEPMPGWIQELADWSMNTGNRKKIDELLGLRFGDKYKTPWTPEEINNFKYGKKYIGVPNAPQTSIVEDLIENIFPKEVYHRNPKKVFDKFDLTKAGIREDGSTYKPNFGKGAYVSVKNDPALSKLYGDYVSKFNIKPGTKLLKSKDVFLANVIGHPYFKNEFMGEKFKVYLNKKGYAGIDNGWEQVYYNPDNNLKPANTPLQRLANRIPKESIGKMANKLMGTASKIAESPIGKATGSVLSFANNFDPLFWAMTLPQLGNLYDEKVLKYGKPEKIKDFNQRQVGLRFKPTQLRQGYPMSNPLTGGIDYTRILLDRQK